MKSILSLALLTGLVGAAYTQPTLAPAPKMAAAGRFQPEAVEAGIPKLVGSTSEPWLITVTVKNVPKNYNILWDLAVKDPRTGFFFEGGGGAQYVVDNVKQAFTFAGPAGNYKLKCRLLPKTDKGEQYELLWEGSLTGGVAPVPVPPNPVPPAPLPNGRLGLTKVSRDSLALVNDTNKATIAKQIAGNTRALASAIAAGGLADPSTNETNAKAALKKWSDDTIAVISANKANTDEWMKWSTPVAKSFYSLYNNKSLKTKTDWVDAFNEIADGLSP